MNYMMKILHWIKDNPLLAFLALLALVATIFAVITLWRFTGFSTFDSSTGVIGDTFGIMNPFIAIAAAIITFAAFWVQYQANQFMLNENRKQQIITRFYELLKIHRENVNEFKWVQNIYNTKDSSLPTIKPPEENSVEKQGRQIFYYYLTEFTLTYEILNILAPHLKKKEMVKRAYSIFYFGSEDKFFTKELRKCIFYSFAESDKSYFSSKLTKIFEEHFLDIDTKEVDDIIQVLFQYRKFFISQPPFFGHFEELNNYYRHLFLTVKTIADEDEKYITFDEKRNLLQILRAQLSNREQIMLFYNWFCGYGSKWEEESIEGNHFFTQFRMIHNIMPQLMPPFRTEDEDCTKAFKKFVHYFSNCSAIIKFGTKNDPIFEFEETDYLPRFKYDK